MTQKEQNHLVKFFDFLREEHAGLLILFTKETIETKAKQFLLEQEAVKALDDAAISEGYKDAADKVFQLEEIRKAEEAKEKALQEAIEAAKKKEEDERLAEQVEAARIAQLKRDLQDAENVAKEKAQKIANEIAAGLTGKISPVIDSIGE